MAQSMQGTTKFRCFVAASANSCASTATTWMQPMLVRYLVVNRGLNEAAAGLLLTVELAATALSSLVLARLIPRRYAQGIALAGMGVAVLASLLTLYIDNYGALLVTRILVGLGAGTTIMINNIVVANFPDPEKMYARQGTVNLILGYVLVWVDSWISSIGPAASASPYAVLFIAMLVLLPLMAVLPRLAEFDSVGSSEYPYGTPEAASRPLVLHTSLLASVTFAIVVSSGILWGLYGLLGERANLSASLVDSAIEASIFAGFVGTIVCAFLGSSFGRIGPFCASLALMNWAILVLTSHPGAHAFEVAVCVNVAAIYFILPYLSGAAIVMDSTGRSASYVSSAFFVGTAVSPFIGGVLLTTIGAEPIGKLVVAVSVVAAVVYIYVVRLTPARLAAAVSS